MADSKTFLKIARAKSGYRPVCERVRDWSDVTALRPIAVSRDQASRCMDCGTPFCHWGCPIGNYIPEWNDLMGRGEWERAYDLLKAANNLPEITGRLCPAPCEYSCVLGINDDPITIRENELAIIEYALKKEMAAAKTPAFRTGRRIAIIGSGPAGLSCADQLNQAGHSVTVFERDKRCGGILRYGIPDFKLEKWIIDRRLDILQQEGVRFVTGQDAMIKPGTEALIRDFDAVCLACGSRAPRDLAIDGRHLEGVYFAMDYLTDSNKRLAGEPLKKEGWIDSRGKKVLVIGGGDTGADCVGTAHRQGADCVIQLEVLPKPSECRTASHPWPKYPLLLRTSSSHEEGGQRLWQILTKSFKGEKGKVKKVSCVKVDFSQTDSAGCPIMRESAGTEFEIDIDMVIIAVGFLHPDHQGLINELKIRFDKRGNIQTDGAFMTSRKGVFACGDARRGQSLIVWAISEGRRAAHEIDKFLMGSSRLPSF